MKTKQRGTKPPDKIEPVKPQSEPQNAPLIDQNASSDPRVALVFYKTPDGKPDFSRMQPRVKENFRKFYEDADNRKAIGLTAPEPSRAISAGTSSEVFGQDEVDAFYNGLEFVDAVIAAKLYKVPFEMAQEAFSFDEFQRGKLSPRTLRLLNKWGPKILAQWKDEIGLGIVLFSTVSAQSRKLRKLRRGHNAAPAPVASEPEKVPEKVRSIVEEKPQPRTTPERPGTGTASDTVDLENEVGFHL